MITAATPRVWESMATARRGARTGDISGFHAYVRPDVKPSGTRTHSYVIFFRSELVATGFASSAAAAKRRAGDRLDLIEDAISDYLAPLVRLVKTSPAGPAEVFQHLAAILPGDEYEQLKAAVKEGA